MKLRLILIGIFLIQLNDEVNAQNPIEKEGWTLTFSDEFNSQKLDYKKWTPSLWWGGVSDKISYLNKSQIQMTGSTVKLVADKTSANDTLPYKTGLIATHNSFTQQYGYFEIRSKNPSGTGFWPAFWLATAEKWPPEIDIYEYYTDRPRHLSTTHHWKTKRGKKKMQPKGFKLDEASEDFHIFALEWTPKKLVWYYDNEKVRTTRRALKYFDVPMHIIINNRVGGYSRANLPEAKFPNALEVDYVRAYQRKTE
jgi:beta-glucanase (GH16 family)